MARQTKKQTWKEWQGFAIELQPDTDLGLAMRIAEFEGGAYEPIAVASTINEAKELAAADMDARIKRLEPWRAPRCRRAPSFVDSQPIFLTLPLILLLGFRERKVSGSSQLPVNPPPAGCRGAHVSSGAGPVPPHAERVPPAVSVTGPPLPDALAILAELPE